MSIILDDKKEEDQIRPKYYAEGAYEAIDVIENYDLGFCLGNAVKYILRAGKKTKDPLLDLKKARWYLTREINRLERRNGE